MIKKCVIKKFRLSISTNFEFLKTAGFDVYMKDGGDTYCYFTDGVSMGYVQHNPRDGYSFSTCHKPNRTTGTGFRVDQSADLVQTAKNCFVFAPSWASSEDVKSVKKWQGIEDFRSASKWNAGFTKQ